MDILAIGEPLMELSDIDYEGCRVYLPGYGGDTSNFIIAASRQGVQTAYFTHVGNDTFGNRFLKLWSHEGVDADTVKVSETAHTGIYFITHTDKGHEFSYMRKGSAASLVTPDDLPVELIKNCRLLHISGISQAISDSACDTIFAAARIARENGVKVSYDANLRLKLWSLDRARAVIHATVPLCDVYMPSLEDSVSLTGLSDPKEIIEYYHKLGAVNVILKCGKNGVIVSGPENGEKVYESIPGFVVDTVDQTGAGDTFDGAFCAKYLSGGGLIASANYANAAAALSTKGYGAVTPIPRRVDVEAFLASKQ